MQQYALYTYTVSYSAVIIKKQVLLLSSLFLQFTRDNLCYYRSNRSIKAGYIVNDLAPSHSSCHYLPLPLPLPPLSVYSTPQKKKVLYFTQKTVDSFSRNLPQPVSDAIAAPSLYSDSDIVATYMYISVYVFVIGG